MVNRINTVINRISVGIILLILCSCESAEQKYAGTWSSPPDNKIVVKLDANTMKADITIHLGDTPISYTSNWEIVEGRGIVYNDYYGHGQASIIGFDGELYTFNSNTGRITDTGVRMRHTK